MPKVFIIDDHKIMREGIKSVLTGINDIQITGESPTATNIINKLRDTDTDIVILDISMPDMPGDVAAVYLKKELPALKVITYTMHNEDEYVVKLLKSGVDAYVIKNENEDELKAAIREVIKGNKYICREVQEKAMQFYTDKYVVDNEIELNKNEQTVLKLVAEGMNTKEIADELNLSTKSIDAIRLKVMKKLNFSSIQDLVKYAIKKGIIS